MLKNLIKFEIKPWKPLSPFRRRSYRDVLSFCQRNGIFFRQMYRPRATGQPRCLSSSPPFRPNLCAIYTYVLFIAIFRSEWNKKRRSNAWRCDHKFVTFYLFFFFRSWNFDSTILPSFWHSLSVVSVWEKETRQIIMSAWWTMPAGFFCFFFVLLY